MSDIEYDPHSFPVVDQHLPGAIPVSAPTDIFRKEILIAPGQAAQSTISEAQQNLRGVEGFSRLQGPAKPLVADAQYQQVLCSWLHSASILKLPEYTSIAP